MDQARFVRRLLACLTVAGLLCCAAPAQAVFTTVWELGLDDNGWPRDSVGGGTQADFVQEAGINPPPGNPNSPAVDQQADDDYYYAGTYPTPIGVVANDEIAMERAFAGTDNDLRIHFNLPGNLDPGDRFIFTLDPLNLDGNGADPRYGVEVFFNGNLIIAEMTINNAALNVHVASAPFTAAQVSAVGGPGGDNVIALRGISHSADPVSGGQWLGFDYYRLESEPNPIPEPSTVILLLIGTVLTVPLLVGKRKQ